MQLIPGTIAKGGAQGVFALASPEWNVGIAIKVEDGQQRAIPAIVVEVLKQLGLLSVEHQEALSQWNPERVLNWKGTEVGQIRPIFQLQKWNSKH
jgi:L-asparaginase II